MNVIMRLLAVCAIVGLVEVAVAPVAKNAERPSVSSALTHRAEELMFARCSVCHSADLITQQRLSKERWKATIEKMRRWGADLSLDEADVLIRYLVTRYDPEAPDHLPPMRTE